jgi:hypothetical protein
MIKQTKTLTTKHRSLTTATAKRKYLQKPLMLAAASLSLGSFAIPAAATTWWSATPAIGIGGTTINVRNKGALGNGVHNDTAAFQAAINALPSSGGTVYVPAGRYMIDAVKAIHMRSHTRLKMDASAELDAIPNGYSRYHVIKVWNVNNVKIEGGKIVGDRYKHKSSTGEWGYGINISGSKKVLVKDVRVVNCWGDGILIGDKNYVRSDYVTLNHVLSDGNRRQGLTLGPSHHVYVVNSTFSNTHGTLPQAGMDIEPQAQGPVDTVRVENSVFAHNRGNGVELHANISGIVFVHNTFKTNYGFGVLAVSAPYLTFRSNAANRNGLAGIGLRGTTHKATLSYNALTYNSTHYISPSVGGSSNQRDLNIASTTWAIYRSGNKLTP